jgi:uncharacterized Rossmann fold enzyme
MLAVYDLAVSPPTYDFVSFLLCAESARTDSEKLEILVVRGPKDGFRDDNLPPSIGERQKMLENVVLPMCDLLPGCTVRVVNRDEVPDVVDFPIGYTRDKPKSHYGLHRTVEVLKEGFAPFRIDAEPVPGLVTVTLREATYWPSRNSRLPQWLGFANWAKSNGKRVVFIRDTARAGDDLDGFECDHLAAVDLKARARLYASAELNIGIANGPMGLAMGFPVKTIMMRLYSPDAPCVSENYYEACGLKRGYQFGRTDIRLSYEDDRAENIIRVAQEGVGPINYLCEDDPILRSMISRNTFRRHRFIEDESEADGRVVKISRDVVITGGLDGLTETPGAFGKGVVVGGGTNPLPEGLCASYDGKWPAQGTQIVCFDGDVKPWACGDEWVGLLYKVGGERAAEYISRANVDTDVLMDNFRANCARDVRWVRSGLHSGNVCLVGGGPSLNDTWKNIRERQKRGQQVWALNNTHDWLIERKIIPDAMVILDARPENAEFVKNARDDVRYYVAAQCHPKVFEALEGRDVYIWHGHLPDAADFLKENYPNKPWCVVAGGGTVGLKSMYLARLLGFSSLHMYGFDSCYRAGENHAYRQPLNDGEDIKEVFVMGRKFLASPWMTRQAQDFQLHLNELTGDGMAITVHGDGLIPFIAQCAKKEQSSGR